MLTLLQLGERFRPGAVPAVALLFGIDLVLYHRDPLRPVAGVLDESAHLITAALLLAALPISRQEPFLRGALAGAVLIDLDHIPGEFGSKILTRGSGRPLVHSVPSVAMLLLLAALSPPRRRTLLHGASFGVLTHFFRDMAHGGVPLRWPIDRHRVTIPYALYLAILAGASLRVTGVGRRRSAA